MLLLLGAAHAGGGCDADELAAAAKVLAGPEPGDVVAIAAAAFEEACRSPNDVLEAAGDVSAVSPERRRILDLELATRDEHWLAVCPQGASALGASVRMARDEGRGHVYDACKLAAFGWFTRDEWVSALGGLTVLPLSAASVLPQAGVPPETARVLVRGLAGLASPPAPRGTRDLLPTEEELIAAAEQEHLLHGPAPLPPVPVPVPVPVPETVPVSGGFEGGVLATALPAAAEPVRVKPTFVTQAPADWSKAAREAGGACVVRLRVGPKGKLLKVTFLECDPALQGDVNAAAAKSSYTPATEDGVPVPGAFRATWRVE